MCLSINAIALAHHYWVRRITEGKSLAPKQRKDGARDVSNLHLNMVIQDTIMCGDATDLLSSFGKGGKFNK